MDTDAQNLKLISVVTPCYNEEDNVRDLYEQVCAVLDRFEDYRHEHVFIDNASTDGTVAILRELAGGDPRVKVILNARNFGHIRSPYYGMLQAKGDAVVVMASDLQDPPCLIGDFIAKWEEGYRMAIGVKTSSDESRLMYALRSVYYKLVRRLANVELVEHFTGFGLYDKQVIDILRSLNDPYPYLRGLIAEIGFDVAKVEFTQPVREKGITKNNLYTLFDMALLGLTSHSRVPLRLSIMVGFVSATMSLFVALFYLVYKVVFWDTFSLGIAPLVVGLFFFGSVQLFFLGIVGEYVGAIHTYAQNRPLVIERERINFDEEEA